MLTLKRVNKVLIENGMNPDTELVKGEGYYYFFNAYWPETSVMVYTLNQYTIEQWISEYKYKYDLYLKTL